MGTVTINLSDEVEDIFRKNAKETHGEGKGKLKEAIEEAILTWAKILKNEEARQKVIAILKKGIPLGYKPYRSRDELHDRTI